MDAARILPPASERPRFVCAACGRDWPVPLTACPCGERIRVPANRAAFPAEPRCCVRCTRHFTPADGTWTSDGRGWWHDCEAAANARNAATGPLVEASTGAGAICWIAVACAAMAAILAALVLLKHL